MVHQPVQSLVLAGHHLVADGLGKHLLHVVVGGEQHLAGVEPDQVGRPLLHAVAGHQRGVAGHGHHIAVALQAGHVGRLAHGAVQVAVSYTHLTLPTT